MTENSKFCEFCGNKVHIEAVICPKCGRQLEKMKTEEDSNHAQVVINNNNTVNNVNQSHKKECDKWISLALCMLLGVFGAHKFYEGKTGLGILYLFTAGFFIIGCVIDAIVILCKPNPYYV